MKEMDTDLAEKHRETVDLLSRPEWVEEISRGKEEVKRGVPGKSLDELEDSDIAIERLEVPSERIPLEEIEEELERTDDSTW